MEPTCGNHWAAIVAAIWLVHSIFEYWIGKTSKTKASSLIELAVTAGLSLIVLLLKRGDRDGEGHR